MIQAHGLGLGNITVFSALDQPFNAEVELFDVGSLQLTDIKPDLAVKEEYERLGIDKVSGVNLLAFNVTRNRKGHPVIKVTSKRRISDPYMQLLLDVVWPKGQTYRSYTIFLDPPNYKLNVIKKQLHRIAQRQTHFPSEPLPRGYIDDTTLSEVKDSAISLSKVDHKVTYGPTVTHETIWQIAQRYKTENISLQQIILAIVGTNPEAFTEGNLNGLKTGLHIQIPTTTLVAKIPAVLAKTEVLAHDNAWQKRKPIEHTLLPPYIDGVAPAAEENALVMNTPKGDFFLPSKIQPIHESILPVSKGEPSVSSLIPLTATLLHIGARNTGVREKNKIADKSLGKTKAEMNVYTSAINAIRESNAVLKEQLKLLQAENKRLRHQLAQYSHVVREKNHSSASRGDSMWLWILLLFLVGLVIMTGFIYRKWKLRAGHEMKLPTENITPLVSTPESMHEEQPSFMEKPMILDSEKTEPEREAISEVEEFRAQEQQFDSKEISPLNEKLSEPEMTLMVSDTDMTPEKDPAPLISDLISTEQTTPKPDIEILSEEDALVFTSDHEDEEILVNEGDEHTINFEFSPVEPVAEEQDKEINQSPAPVKSKVALDTLLDLATTYISMNDIETAKQSLQEVLAFGNKKQKAEAQRILDGLEKP